MSGTMADNVTKYDNKIPTVSIGMPVYNGGKYIRTAIDSLLSQSFSDFELIISDNASSDDTRELCELYNKKDKRIRIVVQQENMGAAWNFQYVLLQATGRYFMWAAADDAWASNWIGTLLEFIKDSDFSVRGKIHYLEHSGITSIIQPKDFSKNTLLKFFLPPETLKDARHFYNYGLFRTDQLKCLDRECLQYGWHPDFLYVYSMLQQGNLRTTSETYQIYRINKNGEGTRLVNQKSQIKRFLYCVHPWSYYCRYLHLTPKNKVWLIALLIPVKYIYNQISLWIRVGPNNLKKILYRLDR